MPSYRTPSYSSKLTNFISLLITTLIISTLACLGIVEYMPRYMQNGQQFVTYTEPPYLTRPDGLRTSTFEAGHGMVLNVTGIREPYECWGEFVTFIQGPVHYSFPILNSSIISEKRVHFTMPILLDLPAELPSGTYKMKRIAKPFCHGLPLRPYALDMYDLTFTITPSHR